MKPELNDLGILVCMNIFGFGLWYFAKYHLNFDAIQVSPILFILALGILAMGGAIVGIAFKLFEAYKAHVEGKLNDKNS